MMRYFPYLNRYFPLQRNKDIAFEIGRMLMALKEYEQASKLFESSAGFCGEHHITWYV